MFNYLRHMISFYHIVDSGGISAAANRLNLSKSVISQQLKDLERELGVSLLNRTTRQQMPTPAGEVFFERCRAIKDIACEAWEGARESQQLPLGTLRITAPNAFIEPIVAPAVGELVGEHPGITPTLLSDDQRVDLIKDEIDLAIRVGEMPSSDYKQRKLGSFRDVLCASPGFLDKNNISQRLIDSKAERHHDIDYIANSWQGVHIVHTLHHKRGGDSIKLSFRANRRCNSLAAVLALATRGCGLAYIPDFVYNMHHGQLLEVLPDHQSAAVPIFAVRPFTHSPPTVVRLATDAIERQLRRGMDV